MAKSGPNALKKTKTKVYGPWTSSTLTAEMELKFGSLFLLLSFHEMNIEQQHEELRWNSFLVFINGLTHNNERHSQNMSYRMFLAVWGALGANTWIGHYLLACN